MPPNESPTSKASSVTVKIPELMLQDDRHLLRVLRVHPRRQLHARGIGGEGDLEMMVARQALLGDVGEHGAHDAAQRGLRQDVVADMIDRHGVRLCGSRDSLGHNANA